MEEQTCKCGCGEILPATNKTGWKWGHKSKPAAAPGQESPSESREAPAVTVDQPAVVYTSVNCVLTEAQIERIWTMLPLPEKALAITEALLAFRE